MVTKLLSILTKSKPTAKELMDKHLRVKIDRRERETTPIADDERHVVVEVVADVDGVAKIHKINQQNKKEKVRDKTTIEVRKLSQLKIRKIKKSHLVILMAHKRKIDVTGPENQEMLMLHVIISSKTKVEKLQPMVQTVTIIKSKEKTTSQENKMKVIIQNLLLRLLQAKIHNEDSKIPELVKNQENQDLQGN